MDLEQLAKNHENTVSVIATLGTWAAVIASLWIASRSQKPKLRIYANKNVFIPSEAQATGQIIWDQCEDSIGVDIQNIGPITVYIHYWSFIWRFPFFWSAGMQCNPYYPDFRREPIKLEPGQSATISLTNDLVHFRRAIDDLCKRSRVPLYFKRYVKLQITSANGTKFKAKAGRDFKNWIKKT